jgi:GDPmannose 4,6-dehydratase
LVLQQPECTEYVVATGQLHTVRDWLDETFGYFGMDWRQHVIEDGSLLNSRQSSYPLCGDATRLQSATGWQPEISFQSLVRDMIESELKRRSGDVPLQRTRSSS